MKNKLAKSTQQTLHVFDSLIRQERVCTFVKNYRETLGIPENGLEYTDTDKNSIELGVESVLNQMLYVPDRIFPLPKEAQKSGIDRLEIVNTLRAHVGYIGYSSERIIAMFRLYFFFNQVIDIPLTMLDYEDDLATFAHLPTFLAEHNREDLFMMQFMYDDLDETSKKYPVALYINPEITLNQLKDFLSKKWSQIQAFKSDEEPIYSGRRKKSKQSLNDFIYKHKDLSRKDIRVKLSAELNVFLDDGHIGKIIDIERKRRN